MPHDTVSGDAAQAESRCPVETTLTVIGGRWKPLILHHLRPAPRRFNALRRLMPRVTQRMLTQHLRELESDGIIQRLVHEQVPPHVEYRLTPKGQSLMPVLDAMARWADAHAGADGPGAGGELRGSHAARPSATVTAG